MRLARSGQVALSLLASAALAVAACGNENPPPKAPPPAPTASAPANPPYAGKPKLDQIMRAEFNRAAAELALPLFWRADDDKDGQFDPPELAVYWGLQPGASIKDYVDADGFTSKALTAYDQIVAQAHRKGPIAGSDAARRMAVQKELAQGRVTLVETKMSTASEGDKRFIAAILRASSLIEALYAKQLGTDVLAPKVPEGDPASKMLFWRGQGPKCEAPATVNDPNCNALLPADRPAGKISGMYPKDLLLKGKFCDQLGQKDKLKDKTLADPFTVVTSAPADTDAALKAAATDKSDTVSPARLAQLKGTPYQVVWSTEMQAIAKELGDAAAAAHAIGASEAALEAYLTAAAKAFGDGGWWAADEAWAKMDNKNSKYYLRIAPDEVYDEPCSTKALFHVSFGLINQGSVTWQQKLEPLKAEMEGALATLAGAPYKARDVKFKIPDFVDIAINAGDSRKAFGATIGQSLPNFGPVANGGRGRTVAMTNFYTDSDNLESARAQAESLFCKDTMAKWTDSPEPQLMGTVLHEAAHNLGPAHQYKAFGKIDRESFGGPLASTLEELKAQTAALYFTDWLIDKKQITREDADKAHVRDIFWAFGHISRGMYNAEHHPNNYSHLAAIQLGVLMKEGAITWKPETAANAKDEGCFAIDIPKMPAAIKVLMTQVAQIKAKGDKPAAEALIKTYVDVTGDKKKVQDVITERITRAPKSSFVYSVKLE